jgi:hypothetical protein
MYFIRYDSCVMALTKCIPQFRQRERFVIVFRVVWIKVQWTFFLLNLGFFEAFAVAFMRSIEAFSKRKGIGNILRVFYFIVVHQQAGGRDLPLMRFTISHTFFIVVFEFSFDTYDLQLCLFDSLIVRRAFAQRILIDSSFDCNGFCKNFFFVALLFLTEDLQSSLNHGFCHIFNLPHVFGIVLSAISISVHACRGESSFISLCVVSFRMRMPARPTSRCIAIIHVW